MKHVFLSTLALCSSVSVLAGNGIITGDEALASSANSQLENAIGHNESSTYAILPRENGGGEALFYAVSGGYNRTGTRSLLPVSTHHCALAMIESNSDNHTRAEVYPSGGYWYLSVWSVGNGGSKTGKAVCFPRS